MTTYSDNIQKAMAAMGSEKTDKAGAEFLAIYRRLRAQKERLTGNMEDLMPVIARLVRRADPTIPLGDRVQAAIEVLEQAQQEVSRRSREHAAGDVLNGFQGSSHPGMAAALLILVEKDRG